MYYVYYCGFLDINGNPDGRNMAEFECLNDAIALALKCIEKYGLGDNNQRDMGFVGIFHGGNSLYCSPKFTVDNQYLYRGGRKIPLKITLI